MITSRDIVREVGVMLLGFPLAFVADFCVRFLWPEMATPVFFCVLIGWMLPGTGFFRYHEMSQDKSWLPLAAARRETRFWPNSHVSGGRSRWLEYIFNKISITLFGFVLAVFTGGLIGLLLPTWRWGAFIAMAAFYLLGTIHLIRKDRRNAQPIVERRYQSRVD